MSFSGFVLFMVIVVPVTDIISSDHESTVYYRYAASNKDKKFAGKPESITTVSYTHLDVYKRQVLAGTAPSLLQILPDGAKAASADNSWRTGCTPSGHNLL